MKILTNKKLVKALEELRHQRDIVMDECDMVAMICETIYTLKIKEETKVEWSKVPVDTKILVSNDGLNWHNRHFATFRFYSVFAWDDGATSWTTCRVTKWKYARLKENKRRKKNDK